MRSRIVLSAAFVAATVAPVMSVPAPAPDGAELSRWNSGKRSVGRRSWNPPPIPSPPIPSPPPVPSCWETGTCKRQDIETEIVGAINNAIQQGVITQDEGNTLLQLPQHMTTPQDSLLLLETLQTNPRSLLPSSTGGATTQAKREWVPPPIPSCWETESCKRDVKRDWSPPPIPTPPPIPSCWWTSSCKRGVDLD